MVSAARVGSTPDIACQEQQQSCQRQMTPGPHAPCAEPQRMCPFDCHPEFLSYCDTKACEPLFVTQAFSSLCGGIPPIAVVKLAHDCCNLPQIAEIFAARAEGSELLAARRKELRPMVWTEPAHHLRSLPLSIIFRWSRSSSSVTCGAVVCLASVNWHRALTPF